MSDELMNKCIEDKYEIQNIICIGPSSNVYLGKNIETDETIIIKIIKKIKYKTDNKIKSDTEIPKLLDHPNIIKIKDIINTETHAYIVYPYINNNICLSQIKKINLYFVNNEKKFIHMIKMMCQICDAIEYMHSQNVVHRDIKPHNIILGENFALLIDFDLAYVIDNPNYPLKLGIIGTPNYIAPEIWKELDNINYLLADIYSFGVTLYYIFNKKKLPYNAETIESLEYQLRYNKPIPSHSGYHLLDKLIMTVISKDPKNRPPISEIRQTLCKIILL
jgi:serine/threonine protein kinase